MSSSTGDPGTHLYRVVIQQVVGDETVPFAAVRVASPLQPESVLSEVRQALEKGQGRPVSSIEQIPQNQSVVAGSMSASQEHDAGIKPPGLY